jgi:hypothetical protein
MVSNHSQKVKNAARMLTDCLLLQIAVAGHAGSVYE